jgi:hypothetical protein
MTKNGSEISIYLDGAPVFSDTTEVDSVITTAPMTFGRSTYWASQYFEGMIDEVRIYDRTLNASEIATLSVPEPATILLLSLGGILLRRKQLKS